MALSSWIYTVFSLFRLCLTLIVAIGIVLAGGAPVTVGHASPLFQPTISAQLLARASGSPPAAVPGTFYLAPSGATSTCGSRARPCRTPQALPSLPAGARVIAAAGSYPRWQISGRAGTPERPIVIQSASGQRDIVLHDQLRITQSRNLVVDGLALSGAGLWLEDTADVTVRNSRVQGALEDGIRFHRSLRPRFSQVEVRDTGHSCIAAHTRDRDQQQGNPYHGSDVQRYSFGAVIEHSVLANCGFQGIFITTMSAIIRDTHINAVGVRAQDPRVHGIYSKSENALIEGNVIDGAVHNGISVRNTAIVRNNLVRNVGLARGPAHLRGGACYRFFNDGPQRGGLVVFENNICTRPGPYFSGAVALDGTTTEGRGYTFVVRNTTAYIQGGPGLALHDLDAAQVYAQHNLFIRSDKGNLVTGRAGRLVLGANTLRAAAGRAADLFLDAPAGNFTLLAPVAAPALRQDARWSPGAQNGTLPDPRSVTPRDQRGEPRDVMPSMGALVPRHK